MTTAQLAQRVSTRTQAGISVLDVTVADASVGRAVRIADAIAARLLTVAPDLQPRGGPGTTTVRLTEVQRAHPVEPARRDVPLTLGSGALVGLTAGLVLAGLREPRRPAGWERLARP